MGETLARWAIKFAGALAIAAAQAQAQATGGAPARIALVVGNGAYESVAPLPNATRDAQALCKRLRELQFEVHCVENTGSRRELRAAVQRFAAALRPGSVALFYYAGHGVQRRGENYLVPVGAQLAGVADIEDENLPLGYVMEAVGEARASLNLLILDACRENIVPKSLEPFLPQKGFAEVSAPPGTMVVYAAAPGRFAFDGEPSGHSPFTKHLLANIGKPGLSVEALVKQVILGVERDTHRQQTPWLNTSYAGSFCFAGCDDPQLAGQLARLVSEKQGVESRLRELELDRAARQKEFEAMQARVAALQQSSQGLREAPGREAAPPDGGAGAEQEGGRLGAERQALHAAGQQLAEERRRLDAQRAEIEQLVRRSELLEERRRQIELLEGENAKLKDAAQQRERALLDLQEQRRVEARAKRSVERPPAMPVPAF